MKKTREQPKQLPEILSESIEFPLNAISGAPVIHLVGQNQLDIEGCKGILAYTDNEMVLNMGSYTYTIRGGELVLKTLSKTSVIIFGDFVSFHISEKPVKA